MESETVFFTSIFKNEKKMYTENEIEIILKNCKNGAELYKICGVIKFLIDDYCFTNPLKIAELCDTRFRQLHNLNP